MGLTRVHASQITYLNNVVMPDEPGPSNTDSSSEPDDGNEGGEEIVADSDDSEGPI